MPFEIFLATAPGLEEVLADEVVALGFGPAKAVPGGVEITGGWPEVWRANREVRGANRVLARVGAFRAMHLAQLDKRARKFDWASVLRTDVPVKVEATCRRSKIYHERAASQRIVRAITETLGAPEGGEGAIRVMARIEDDLVSLSVDTSGEPLHRRGHKLATGKAPLRETLAALFLRQCGSDGGEPVLDPMCGSGTFPIEAAEIATGLAPGRDRRFAFEDLATFDAVAYQAMRGGIVPRETALRFSGFDRDAGAVRMAGENAARAGVAGVSSFACRPISALTRPEGPPGLWCAARQPQALVRPLWQPRRGAATRDAGLARRARDLGWRSGPRDRASFLATGATGGAWWAQGDAVAHRSAVNRGWQNQGIFRLAVTGC